MGARRRAGERARERERERESSNRTIKMQMNSIKTDGIESIDGGEGE